MQNQISHHVAVTNHHSTSAGSRRTSSTRVVATASDAANVTTRRRPEFLTLRPGVVVGRVGIGIATAGTSCKQNVVLQLRRPRSGIVRSPATVTATSSRSRASQTLHVAPERQSSTASGEPRTASRVLLQPAQYFREVGEAPLDLSARRLRPHDPQRGVIPRLDLVRVRWQQSDERFDEARNERSLRRRPSGELVRCECFEQVARIHVFFDFGRSHDLEDSRKVMANRVSTSPMTGCLPKQLSRRISREFTKWRGLVGGDLVEGVAVRTDGCQGSCRLTHVHAAPEAA